MRYNDALQVGLSPYEFWSMSLAEIKDTVNSRLIQRQNDIYALSSMVRVAVLSVFSSEAPFPKSADEAFDRNKNREGNWINSYNYLKAVQEMQRGCNK